MKINGIVVNRPRDEVVVIPRPSGNLVFKAKTVLDYSEFDELCPSPKIPYIQEPGKPARPNLLDPKYVEERDSWADRRTSYMILKSLEATEGLEFETVNLSDPTTWNNWQLELEQAGFSALEINRIIEIITTANGLNQTKIDEATEAFLAGLEQE